MFKKSILIFVFLILCVGGMNAQSTSPCESTSYGLTCVKQELDLVGSKITIKTYIKKLPNKIIDRTFVVVHANEEKGLDSAKKVISENYGRLVEVVSNYKGESTTEDNKRRRLYFGENQKYCVDPNRIYTKAGIAKNLSDCQPISNDKIDAIFKFGQELIKIVTNNNTYRFIVGVHNNTEDEGLNVNFWRGRGEESKTALATFTLNNHDGGTTLRQDDFVLVSNTKLFNKIFDVQNPFNIAVQEEIGYLRGNESLDDGSMSLYFGSKLFGNTLKPYDYINIEAGGKDNTPDSNPSKKWQMEIIRNVIKMKL